MTSRPRAERTRDVKRLAEELDRLGLLLHHDATLPSATTLLAGEPIRGSWWGSPHGAHLYDVFTEFAEHGGELSPKLVNGKLTFVARRLWPDFLALAAHSRTKALELPAGAKELLARIGREPTRVDALEPAEFGGSRQLGECVRALGERLLANVGSVHTESGKHVKVLQSWQGWAKAQRVEPASSLAAARKNMTDALALLGAGVTRVTTPWDALLGVSRG